MKSKFLIISLLLLTSFSILTAQADELKRVNVVIVGPGLVGSTLLDQLAQQAPMLAEKNFLDLRVVAIANSRFQLSNPEGLDLTKWRALLAQSKTALHWESFVQELARKDAQTIFVDCTADQTVAESYATLLAARIPVVTPNKRACSSRYAYYRTLKELASQLNVNFLYGANAGAGLPLIAALQEMRMSGDKIIKIEAVLSGTLSYLFNNFSDKKPFSELVVEAQERGYTEPDPRADLSCQDFLRKLLILARESGEVLEMEAIAFTPFLPQSCFEASSVADFYTKLRKCDATLATLLHQAQTEGKKLCMIGSLENGQASLSLKMIGPDHPFYTLSGSDNILSVTSERYRERPFVIRGRGAGADVTAGRVLTEILQTALKL